MRVRGGGRDANFRVRSVTWAVSQDISACKWAIFKEDHRDGGDKMVQAQMEKQLTSWGLQWLKGGAAHGGSQRRSRGG